MILNEFALLASDTARTKAYLQRMILEDKVPGICIVYSDNILKMKKEAEQYIGGKSKDSACRYFDIDKPILYSLQESNIKYVIVESKDINSEQMENALKGLTQKFLIYSGYGGYILKPHLFGMNKKIIHVHAGILPEYRGSTTVYYSFLQEKVFGATALFLNEGIDEGEVIVQDTFEIPKDEVDIDYIYEPYMRSKLLIKVLDLYQENGRLDAHTQGKKEAGTYFVIHPVLKHIAMLGIRNSRKQ